jgi:hypothetical protein
MPVMYFKEVDSSLDLVILERHCHTGCQPEKGNVKIAHCLTGDEMIADYLSKPLN